MKKSSLFIMAAALLASKLYAAPVPIEVQNSKSIPWQAWEDEKQLPKGANFAILAGNPEKPEHFVARFKFPANYQIPTHSHLSTEYVTVLSGALHLKLNKHETLKLAKGDFVKIPAGVEHSSWCSQETIIEESGLGPWGMIYTK